MRYTVIYPFADLHDKKYKYETGDIFPRQGLEVSEDRIKELLSSNNKIRKSLIEEIPEETSEETSEEITEETSEKPKKKTSKRKK